MYKAFFFTVLVLASVYQTGAAAKDTRMDNFESFIKQENQIPSKEHPSLYFSKNEISEIMKRIEDPYFANYVKDLLATADHYMRNTPFDSKFPFSENPNFQIITETLSMAYILSGKKEYSDKARGIVSNFCKEHYMKVRILESGKFQGFLKDGNSPSFILEPLAFAYDCLYDEMSDEERFLVRKSLAYFCKITYEMAVTQEYGLGFHKNYCAGQMGGLGLACIALEDETDLEVHEWFDKAFRVSLEWCNVAIRQDGMYPEGVNYLYYMLRNQLLLFEAAQRKTGIDYFRRTNIGASIEWSIWSSLPWLYEFDNFSDGKYSVFFADQLQILQKNFPGIGDYLAYKGQGNALRYKANPLAIVFGKKPDFEKFKPDEKLGFNKLFKSAGMAGFRTGWGPEDMLLLTYATNYEYAAHSQADRGHFNIYAYNKKWAVDSGYGNDAKIVNSATPSEAHNIVLIDGKGQGFTPEMRQAGIYSKIEAFAGSERLGFVRINQKQAYDFYVHYSYSNKKEYNAVQKAFRNIIFIGKSETPPYALVYDDIKKDDNPHEYLWQFHTSPGNTINISSDSHTSITPLRYTGRIISAEGNGSWNDFKSPGFNIFGKDAGYIKFKISSPEEKDYYLWSLGRVMPKCVSSAELHVNGKFCGRFEVGTQREFCWNRFTLNKDKMHKPEPVHLKKGENTIEVKGLSSGYEIASMFLTANPDYIASEVKQADTNVLQFGAKDVTELKNAVIKDAADNDEAECQLKILNPQGCRIYSGHYQPTAEPSHPVFKAGIKSDAPHFIAFVYPKKKTFEKPGFANISSNEFIQNMIVWKDVTDSIYVLRGKKINNELFETDAQMVFTRTDKNNKIIRLMASGGAYIKINGKEIRPDKSSGCIIVENKDIY